MDQSTTETSSSNSSCPKGLKKRARFDKWEKNRRKRRREQGKGYVTKKNQIEVPAKKFVQVRHCCKNECYKILNAVDQKDQFKSFYKISKQNQDTFLMKNVEKVEIKNASKNPKTNNRNFSWIYYISKNGKREKVCKSFLQKLYQVTDERMKTVLRFCKKGWLKSVLNNFF